MAERRMISRAIIDSDAFLDMPASTQNLYFHLNIRADDEGFIDGPKKIMRSIGANQNDLEILLSKRYLLAFDSGVIVIKHWRLHNLIRKDRAKDTLYIEEKQSLFTKRDGSYTDHPIEDGQPNDNQVTTKCPRSIGEYSIVKGSREEKRKDLLFEIWKHWNSKKELPHDPYMPTHFGIDHIALLDSAKGHGIEKIKQCIDQLANSYQTLDVKPSSPKSILKNNTVNHWIETTKTKEQPKLTPEDEEMLKEIKF